MVDVLPFRGLHYHPDLEIEHLAAPPYDIVGAEQRAALARSSPYNIVHITCPDGDENWHQRAANTLRRWRQERILVQDPQEAFYGYRQVFHQDGQKLSRTGIIARMRLCPWGQGVYRHEFTHQKAREDRLRLLRATRTNTSPVFALFESSEDGWSLPEPKQPMIEATLGGIQHIFWRIDAPSEILRIREALAQSQVVIADGHHRYETALAYQQERRSAAEIPTGYRPYDYVMTYLCAASDPGLEILATHRVIKGLPTVDWPCLLQELSQDFAVTAIPTGESLTQAIKTRHTQETKIGMYGGPAGSWILTLRDRRRVQQMARGRVAPELYGLDVIVLQYLILSPRLGIQPSSLPTTDQIHYTIDEGEARRWVDSGQAQIAFLLNPTHVDQVWQAAIHGVTMPQKSTYFYPKLLTGLIFYPLDDMD